MLVESEIKNLREENSKLKQELSFYKQQIQKIDLLIGDSEKQLQKTENKTNNFNYSSYGNFIINNNNSKKLYNKEDNNINNNPNFDKKDLIYLKQEIKINELNFQMEALKEEFIVKEISMRREFEAKKSEYELRISNLVSKLDLLEHKNDVFMKYETYMNELETYNKDLIKTINDLNVKYEADMEQGKRTLGEKIEKVKKKMLNLINVTKANFRIMIDNQVEYNSKILLLQNTQLFDELAEQSKHLEELHKKLINKDKEIISLKLDLEVQKSVQNIFAGNNKKITEMVKSYFDEKEANNLKRKSHIFDKITKDGESKLKIISNSTNENLNHNHNLTCNKDDKASSKEKVISINDQKDQTIETNFRRNCICNCNCNCVLCNTKNLTISNIYNNLITENEQNILNTGQDKLGIMNQYSANIHIENNREKSHLEHTRRHHRNKVHSSNINDISSDIEKEKNYPMNIHADNPNKTEKEQKQEFTEQEKYYAMYKKNYIIANFQNKILHKKEDSKLKTINSVYEKKKLKNNMYQMPQNSYNEDTKLILPLHKNFSNFKTIEVNSDRNFQYNSFNKNRFLRLEKLNNSKLVINTEKDEEKYNHEKDNKFLISNPTTGKNKIFEKIKKEISKFNYDKIFQSVYLNKKSNNHQIESVNETLYNGKEKLINTLNTSLKMPLNEFSKVNVQKNKIYEGISSYNYKNKKQNKILPQSSDDSSENNNLKKKAEGNINDNNFSSMFNSLYYGNKFEEYQKLHFNKNSISGESTINLDMKKFKDKQDFPLLIDNLGNNFYDKNRNPDIRDVNNDYYYYQNQYFSTHHHTISATKPRSHSRINTKRKFLF